VSFTIKSVVTSRGWRHAEGLRETIARHKAVDLLRRTLRARSRDHTFTVLAAGNLADPEIEHLLKVRIAGLPPRLREFYDLHYTQAWSEREIAARLGMCRASVQWLDHCCRRDIIGPRVPAQSCPNPSEAFRAGGGTNPASVVSPIWWKSEKGVIIR